LPRSWSGSARFRCSPFTAARPRERAAHGNWSCPAATGVCVVNTHSFRARSMSAWSISERPAARAVSSTSSSARCAPRSAVPSRADRVRRTAQQCAQCARSSAACRPAAIPVNMACVSTTFVTACAADESLSLCESCAGARTACAGHRPSDSSYPAFRALLGLARVMLPAMP
jgi:hypothetical protein